MSRAGSKQGIREASAADGPAVAEIYAPFVRGSTISFEATEPDGEEMASRISRAEDAYPWLVCESEGEVLGYAYGSAHRGRAAYRWAVEVSVYVGESSHRSGVARGLYTSLLQILRLQRRCLALAGITLPNPASVGFHEALGFESFAVYRNIGHKHGAWHDVGWWQLQLGDPPPTPLEPLKLSAVRDKPAFSAALGAGESQLRL